MTSHRIWLAGWTLLLTLLAGSSVSHADARQDLTDMRHGRWPVRFEPLGWSDRGDFYYREMVCEDSASEYPPCHAAVVKVSADGTDRMELFDQEVEPDQDRGGIDLAAAREFIRREREVLDSLPPLRPPGSSIDARSALGPDIELVIARRSGERPYPGWDGEVTRMEMDWSFLAAVGHGRSRWVAGILAPELVEVSLSAGLDRAYRRPDGRSVAVVARYRSGPQCLSYGDGFVVRLIDGDRVRSSLGM